MSLLRDIQAAAVDPNTDVATLLMQCKILAKRLGSVELADWINSELSGYPDNDSLPSYRIIRTESFGDFYSSYGNGIKNAPIPPRNLPEVARDYATTSHLSMPVSTYAALLKDSKNTNFQEPWPSNVVGALDGIIYQNMSCLRAWKLIPFNFLASLIDGIKTKILDFVLEIESYSPDAGEAPLNEPLLPEKTVSQVFNTYISGSVQNVATGSTGVSQNGEFSLHAGDFEGLRKFLEANGLERTDIDALENAIEEDTGDSGEQSYGDKVQGWLGKMVGKSASGVWSVSTSTASTLLTNALSTYFGQ